MDRVLDAEEKERSSYRIAAIGAEENAEDKEQRLHLEMLLELTYEKLVKQIKAEETAEDEEVQRGKYAPRRRKFYFPSSFG